MRVAVISFGSSWWARSESDPRRFARYNSSGIKCGRKVRRHWIVPGMLRFNGISNFSSWPPQLLLGRCFRCSELSFACGGNRLLFVERLADSAPADCYLVTISSRLFGVLDLALPTRRSGSSLIVAASQLRECQEIVLLIEPGGWLQTSTGFWQLRQSGTSRRPQMVLLDRRSTAAEITA